MNLYFTADENEKLLTQTAAVRKADNDYGPGVVLIPSQHTLCKTDNEEDARLISKLFNRGLEIQGS